MCGCRLPKCFIAITCNFKWHAILWSVISVKLHSVWKITRLGMMTLICYTVYSDILENRQVGRKFKLV